VKSADFTLDSNITTKDVTDKDQSGNIFRDYTFSDVNQHTVKAVVNFLVEGKVVQSTDLCQAKVTPKQPPVCEFNPNLPPNHPDCKKPECVEKPGSGFPPGDERCKLPVTGPAGMAGLFTGVTAVGAVGHRLLMNYRRKR
jgi:hypothetical protein